MAGKEDIIRVMEQFQSDVEQTVAAMPEAAWSGGIYEDGWNARQILCHIASTSGVAGFLMNLAQAPSGQSMPAGFFDVDDFNKAQVEMRAGKSPSEVLSEIRATLQRDAATVQAADDALLNRQFKTPWELEGPLGDLIVNSFRDHLGIHLTDLRSAAGPRRAD
jgi:hypothetical protein